MSEKKFECIVDNGDDGVVKCNACGCQFDFSACGEQNLEWHDFQKRLVLVCPACNNGKPLQ
jgi:hypothetical protein